MRVRMGLVRRLAFSGCLALAACGESHTAGDDDGSETDESTVVAPKDAGTGRSLDAALSAADAGGADAGAAGPIGPKPTPDSGMTKPPGPGPAPGVADAAMPGPMHDGGGPPDKPDGGKEKPDGGKEMPPGKPDGGKPMPDGGKPKPMDMPGDAMPDAPPPGPDAG